METGLHSTQSSPGSAAPSIQHNPVQVQRLRHPGFEGCEVRAQRARRVLLGRQPVLRRRACTKFICHCKKNSGGSDCGHLAFWLRILVELVVVEV